MEEDKFKLYRRVFWISMLLSIIGSIWLLGSSSFVMGLLVILFLIVWFVLFCLNVDFDNERFYNTKKAKSYMYWGIGLFLVVLWTLVKAALEARS